MWKFIEHWIIEPARREGRWWGAYAAALVLTLAWPSALALPAGVILLSAETIHWLRSIGREMNLAGILRVTVLLTMWVAPALAYWGAGADWYSGHVMPVPAETYWTLAAPGAALLNGIVRMTWGGIDAWGVREAPAPTPLRRGGRGARSQSTLSIPNRDGLVKWDQAPFPFRGAFNLTMKRPPGVSTPPPSPLRRGGRGACSRSTLSIPNRDGWVKSGRAPLPPRRRGDGGGVDTLGEPSNLKLMAMGDGGGVDSPLRHLTLTLLLLGLSAQLALPSAPPALRQIFHLLSLLTYTGILYGILAWPARRWQWVVGGSVYAGVLALQTALFGSALMWVLTMCLLALKGRPVSAAWRYGLAAAGAVGLWVLLSFKYEYRKVLHETGRQTSSFGLFAEMLGQQIAHPERIFNPAVLETAVNRFNQGYYLAQTMAWTPSREPFARGETLWQDLKGALLPRFLAPDKHRAGGYENMARFAGVSGRSYSMNIGIFGEAYANFGIAGGIVCLIGYGLLLALLMRLSIRYLDPPWWPFLWLPALHVESDIGIVLNHLVKAGLIMAVLLTLLSILHKRHS